MNAADLTTWTPPQIDARLAELADQADLAQDNRDSGITQAHTTLGERRKRIGKDYGPWPTTTDEAIEACRKLADPDGYSWTPEGKAHLAVTRYDTAGLELAEIADQAAPLNAEFDRRGGWPRFFTVQQTNGHVHSSTECSTCHNGLFRTHLVWNTELSGLTEAEAIAGLGRWASSLCTVCYPTAPVEWTDGRALAAEYCPGTGQTPQPDTTTWRQGWSSSTGNGKCPTCNTYQRVTAAHSMAKHKPPKGE